LVQPEVLVLVLVVSMTKEEEEKKDHLRLLSHQSPWR